MTPRIPRGGSTCLGGNSFDTHVQRRPHTLLCIPPTPYADKDDLGASVAPTGGRSDFTEFGRGSKRTAASAPITGTGRDVCVAGRQGGLYGPIQ